MFKTFNKKAGIVRTVAAAVLILSLFGCSSKEEEFNRYDTQVWGLFDTYSTFTAYTADEETFNEYAQQFESEMTMYHQLSDIYDDFTGINNVKTINDNAGTAPVAVDERLIDMIEEAIDLYYLTDGRVNVAMGSVLSLWHEYREMGNEYPERAAIPSDEELLEAAKHMDIDNVIIDKEAGTVYLADPDMSLDLGAVAKGYAAEKIALSLKESGLKSALVNMGGDIHAIGTKPGEVKWAVGIQDPFGSTNGDYLYALDISDISLVTSGTYQRYYVVDGVNYHHIIHPDLLRPWDRYVSISVMCDDGGMADGLSTGIFNMELDEGMALIESLDGVEAMWIESDGTEYFSSGFKDYIQQ